MGIGTLLIGTALLVVILAFVLAPLFGDKQPAREAPGKTDQLERERQQVVLSIRELDQDYRTSKVTDTDYHSQRIQLVERGTEILKELDAIAKEPVDVVQHEIELSIKHAREAEHRCPSCRHLTVSDAQFCAYCGASLAETKH